MKRILGLDLGTNSIGWALISNDFENKKGEIEGLGVRIIPMTNYVNSKTGSASKDPKNDFRTGIGLSAAKSRTSNRGVRRLYQRDNLRRERLHRVLNILDFLPKHYSESIDFVNKLGQFKPNTEVKINYRKNSKNQYEFIFLDSFQEMILEFKKAQPQLFYKKENGEETKIPFDWTLYYLRQKGLTQKLTKEELAWIILNFNQKRGYYQLRGEDTEDKSKKEFVEILKIVKIEKEGIDKNNKNKNWFKIYFENGWSYSSTFLNEPSWLNTEREFLIIEEYDKDGNIKIIKDKKKDITGKEKRNITPLPSSEEIELLSKKDQDKIYKKIKIRTELTISHSEKTVGEYIYETLLDNPTQKIRGKLIKTIERKFYKEEFKKIITKQIELQSDLFTNELYLKSIEELYPINEAHKNSIKDKGFEYLFTEDIIFYQRPLKSQKSNISGCQFEYRIYKNKNKETGKIETIKEYVKAISKSHPLFQEFRIWQWLQNLKIYNKENIINGNIEDVTPTLLKTKTDWIDLFDFLNNKKELEQKDLIDYFIKKKLIDKKQKNSYRWNYVYDEEKNQSKTYPFAETRAQFISRLNKLDGLKNIESFLSDKTQVGNKKSSPYISREEQLWHIIYSINDIVEYEKALEKFALKHNLDIESFVDNFKKFPPFESDYGSYSKKSIEKLLPLMRMGKYWDESSIDSQTLLRIQKILDGEFDETIQNRVREKTLNLKSISDFKGLPLWLATYVIYDRHSEISELQQWKSPSDIMAYLNKFKQHSLRNPVVEQVITESLRVVKDIWDFYGKGKEDFFDEIHVELGREMKNPAKKREELSKRINENENTNYRIKQVLKDLLNDSDVKGDIRPYSPSQQDILKIYEEGIYQNPEVKYDKVDEDEIKKIRNNNNPTQKEIQRYKLWLEQGYISPYTGKTISLSKLFTTAYQIEHIIPQSRYFDNSLSNKVICESDVNQDKDNRTAYEYLKEKSNSIVEGHRLFKLEDYESHVNKYFKNNKQKLKNLLSEDIPEGFINRQLNDSRYISKLIKNLLSNIVREDNEQEATSKKLIPVTGAVTSKLRKDWGLNDKWNELVAPRFRRLNELNSEKIDDVLSKIENGENDLTVILKLAKGIHVFKKPDDLKNVTIQNIKEKLLSLKQAFGFWDESINAFRIQVPDHLSKGFNAKRIDHRHHALDALIVACTNRNHTHYLSALNAENKNFSLRNNLLIKNKQGEYTKTFQKPWNGFTVGAKNSLEQTIVSFKQNLRVINKTNNNFWSYKDENGKLNIGKNGKVKKKLRKQTIGDSWAIRKPLHKATISGIYNIETPKGKIATSVRTSLKNIKNEKHLSQITDISIREVIIPNHLKNYIDEKGNPNYESAFSQEGIEDLNKNIINLNNGKKHHKIYKVKLFEIGSKFTVSDKNNTPKNKRYVEAAKGTNLFFAIYWDEKKQKRNFETIPLNEVVAHQKQVAHLPKEERTPIQPKVELGKFLFTLSPNDLVYVPSDTEIENPNLVDFNNLNKEQVNRIYKMVSASTYQCFFVKSEVATSIVNKMEFSTLNKMEKSIDNVMIKDKCWKLKIDRLGNISKA